MRDEHDLTHQPRPIQQNQFVLVAVALLIALVAGTGGYLLGMRKKQSMDQNTQMRYQQLGRVSPTIISNPMPSIDVNIDGWKTYTNTTYNYRIKYPPSLRVNTATADPDSEKYPEKSMVVYFMNDHDNSDLSVVIYYPNPSITTDLKTWISKRENVLNPQSLLIANHEAYIINNKAYIGINKDYLMIVEGVQPFFNRSLSTVRFTN